MKIEKRDYNHIRRCNISKNNEKAVGKTANGHSWDKEWDFRMYKVVWQFNYTLAIVLSTK